MTTKVIETFSPVGRGFDGDKYTLEDCGSWHAIMKTHTKGTPIGNPRKVLHVGKPEYISKRWKSLKAHYNSPNVSTREFAMDKWAKSLA